MTVPSDPRRLLAALFTLCALLLAGCAGALPQIERTPSQVRVAPADAPLAVAVHEAQLPADASGVWPLLQANFALDARLTLIANATTSLDLQYYLIADDPIGRSILRALRDAARRGVRVRLLVDDLYTNDLDHLLLGLAAEPNAEVRLFNPFVTARDSALRRLIALANDFKRLDHRMHNKLFVADGTMAIVGGRNLADEYFFRGKDGNFIDFDLLLAGSVVPELGQWFDEYWNSTPVYPVQDITRASARAPQTPEELRQRFDAATGSDAPFAPVEGSDYFGAPTLHQSLANRHVPLLPAEAAAYADSPGKISPADHSIAISDTLTHRFLLQLSDARREATLMSPYFIPGGDALERIGKLRAEGVTLRIVTNSLAASDEPLVSIGLQRHQTELLHMGVELYELSSTRLKLDRTLRGLLGSSIGRLHAKLGVIDRSTVLVGSMNLDPRSAGINTEIGVRVISPRLAEMVLTGFKVDELAGVYQVKLRPDGRGVRWVAAGGNGQDGEDLDVDPDTSLLLRLRLMLMSWFIPENQL
jgi:cardiolipin synthase C